MFLDHGHCVNRDNRMHVQRGRTANDHREKPGRCGLRGAVFWCEVDCNVSASKFADASIALLAALRAKWVEVWLRGWLCFRFGGCNGAVDHCFNEIVDVIHWLYKLSQSWESKSAFRFMFSFSSLWCAYSSWRVLRVLFLNLLQILSSWKWRLSCRYR